MSTDPKPRHKAWTQSFSAKAVTPAELKPEQVTPADIPNALASKVRFNGQIRRGPNGEVYSVAQHCVIGAQLLPAAFQLPFLLHEVSEVYLPDVPGPMKHLVHVATPNGAVPWSELEKQHASVILPVLGLGSLLPLLDCPEVKRMDWAMLEAERISFHREPPEPWGLPEAAPEGLRLPLEHWPTHEAEAEFRRMFLQLVGRAL